MFLNEGTAAEIKRINGSPAYIRGYEAAKNGYSVYANPYPHPMSQPDTCADMNNEEWTRGYYDGLKEQHNHG
jgi:hypothetical protein